MDTNFFDSPLLFESQVEDFNFESLLSYELGEQCSSDVLSSPSLTGDESVFDSPVTSPSRQDYTYQESPVHDTNNGLSQTDSKNIFYMDGRPLFVPDPISFGLSNMDTVPVKQELFPTMSSIPTVQPQTPPILIPNVTPLSATILIKESEDDDDGKRGTKRTRKRRKTTTPKKVLVTNDRNTITLTREELLSFSSEQFEDFVSQVTDVRELSPNEKNDLKRQRRLIKNRESAHASRQRKKSHIDELERRVKELTNENSLLKDSNSHLTNENNHLKNEVVFLQTVVNNKNGMASLLGRGVNFFNTLGTGAGSGGGVGGGKPSQLQPNSIPATSLVLMIMLFSFGLFFNFGLAGQKPVFQAMEPLPEVITTRVFQQEKYEATAHNKDIFNVLAEQEIPVHRLEQAYRRHLARDLTTKDVIKSNSISVNVDTSIPQETVSQTSHEIVQTNTPVPPSSEVSVSSRPQILHWKSNTTYLLCENVSQLVPPVHVGENGPREDSENPPMISFLIPPDALGGVGYKSQMDSMDTVLENNSYVSSEWNFKGYLEVSCQVVDMNFLANDTSSQVYG